MPRGGKRSGAGRPKGSGKFGEPTKAVRLPVSRIKQIMQFIERNSDVYAVYPSGKMVDKPERCSLIGELLTDSTTTFMVRVSDDSMKGANILAHDLLIVDRSREPKHGASVPLDRVWCYRTVRNNPLPLGAGLCARKCDQRKPMIHGPMTRDP